MLLELKFVGLKLAYLYYINYELCVKAQCHYIYIIDLVFGFEQPSYTFSESVGIANLGVRLSQESGMLSMPLVFTFTTEDGSAIGECRKMTY